MWFPGQPINATAITDEYERRAVECDCKKRPHHDKLFKNRTNATADQAEIPTTTRFSSESRGNDPIEDVNSSTSKSNSSRKPSSTVSLEKTDIERVSGESTKQILLIDDDHDSGLAIKACLETYYRPDPGLSESAIQVTTFIDPIRVLLEFKPYYYDLLLVDINMPSVSGYELVEKIIKLDLNIKVCFMTSGEINYEAITEIRHPTKSFGCFIKKPASNDYLVNRVMQELY
jgi:CheY-like chemotaxis protein